MSTGCKNVNRWALVVVFYDMREAPYYNAIENDRYDIIERRSGAVPTPGTTQGIYVFYVLSLPKTILCSEL